MADREGFEPSIPSLVYSLSRGALSTTQPPVLGGVVVDGGRSWNIYAGFRQGVKMVILQIFASWPLWPLWSCDVIVNCHPARSR